MGSVICCNKTDINNDTEKINEYVIDENRFIKFKVCTFNIRLVQTHNYKNKIIELVDYIYKSNNDIICIQGINDQKILRLIYKTIFMTNRKSSSIKYTIFPDINSYYISQNENISTTNVMEITWSNSESFDISTIDCIILTKYHILNSSKINFGNTYIRNDKCMYIVNLNIHNIIISIYNVTFSNDYIGISNSNNRKNEINELRKIVESNKDFIDSKKLYYKHCGHIDIICCLSNIVELYNNDVNSEYLHFIRILKCIDTYRYIKTIKNKNIDYIYDATNAGNIRNNYILVCSEINHIIDDIDEISKILFDTGLIIYNSVVDYDMKMYEDYPVVTTFLLDKNKHSIMSTDNEIQLDSNDVAIEIL